MPEIKLTVKDQYLHAFLDFLKTLDYVSVNNVATAKKNGSGMTAQENGTDPINASPIKYTELIEEKIDLKKIMEEQNYHGPNSNHFRQFVKELAIEEPIEELLSQLTK